MKNKHFLTGQAVARTKTVGGDKTKIYLQSAWGSEDKVLCFSIRRLTLSKSNVGDNKVLKKYKDHILWEQVMTLKMDTLMAIANWAVEQKELYIKELVKAH